MSVSPDRGEIFSIPPAHVTPDAYRGLIKSRDLITARVVVKQTDLLVSGVRDLGREAGELVHTCRKQLEEYIEGHPRFQRSFVPIQQDPSAPGIVSTMIEAAAKADVGPMASVAGAIAEYVGRGLLPFSREIIIENGGDIFIRSELPRTALLLAESSDFPGIRIEIPPSSNPIGVCTSSGILGHSISLGNADAVMVTAASASLADAAATAIGNIVKRPYDINSGIRRARGIGVGGVVILIKGHIGAWGNIKFLE